MSMSSEDLIILAENAGISVIEHDVSQSPFKGIYDNRNRIISIRADLGELNKKCTLAHELGHAAHNDYGHGNARQERAADYYAANLLIDIQDYRQADILFSGDIAAIAHELDVTRHIITVYRNFLRTKLYML